MKKDTEVVGDARESMLRFQEALLRDATALHNAEKAADRLFEQGFELTSIRVRYPVGEGGGYLGVLKAEGPEGSMIAFHDGATFVEVLIGLLRRIEQNSIKWKEDSYGS